MTTLRKVVGRAVARAVGEYVAPDGSRFAVAEGDVFDLVEGLEKARWFSRVEDGAKTTVAKPAAPTEVPGAGPKKGSRVKADPAGDDIA